MWKCSGFDSRLSLQNCEKGMSNELMIKRIRQMMKEYDMPWKYRVVLSWCVGKLMKEKRECKS